MSKADLAGQAALRRLQRFAGGLVRVDGATSIRAMNVEWLIHHLLFDDDGFQKATLDADLYEDDEWSRLLASLHRNSSLTELKVERDSSHGWRTPEDMENLYRAIRHLELETLEFVAFDEPCVNDNGLEDLLDNHPTLRHFALHMESGSLDGAVLTSLASAQNLQRVKLEVSQAVSSLSNIMGSHSLEHLVVEDMTHKLHMSDTGFQDLMSSLATNESLQVLDLEPLVPFSGLAELASMIRMNRSLRVFRFSLSENSSDNRRVRLEEVWDGFAQVIAACKVNETLVEVLNYQSRFLQSIPANIQQEQVIMLRDNMRLKQFLLFQRERFPSLEDLFLKLNRIGRGSLLEEAEKDDRWIQAIMANSEDLDCLYYFLTKRPSLCQIPLLASSQVSRKRARPISGTIHE